MKGLNQEVSGRTDKAMKSQITRMDVQKGNPSPKKDTISMGPAPSRYSGGKMFPEGPVSRRSRENKS